MKSKLKLQLQEWSYRGAKVPEHLQHGIIAYIVDGITPGAFVTAIVCNDLRRTFQSAAENSVKHIEAIVAFFYQKAPAGCWGDVESMVRWQRERARSPLTEADWTII